MDNIRVIVRHPKSGVYHKKTIKGPQDLMAIRQEILDEKMEEVKTAPIMDQLFFHLFDELEASDRTDDDSATKIGSKP